MPLYSGLEKLATSDRTTIVIERLPDGKMREKVFRAALRERVA
jgi:hypothetical protein